MGLMLPSVMQTALKYPYPVRRSALFQPSSHHSWQVALCPCLLFAVLTASGYSPCSAVTASSERCRWQLPPARSPRASYPFSKTLVVLLNTTSYCLPIAQVSNIGPLFSDIREGLSCHESGSFRVIQRPTSPCSRGFAQLFIYRYVHTRTWHSDLCAVLRLTAPPLARPASNVLTARAVHPLVPLMRRRQPGKRRTSRQRHSSL